MNRGMVMALCGAMAVGCGATNDGGVNPPVDSGVRADTGTSTGTDAGTDAGTVTDRGASTDRGVSTDRGTTPDRPAPATNFGTCGEDVAREVCMCGQTDNVCQSQALSANMDCAQCLVQNQATCCPTQAMALQTCIMDAQMTCSDAACIQTTCMSQVTAMQTCQMNRLQSEAMAGSGACLAGYIGCLGELAQGFGSCP